MAANYRLSNRADEDIKQIALRSLKDFGEKQTDLYMQGLEQTLAELALAPDIGVYFAGADPERHYLRYVYFSHVIYYVKRPHGIFIVRILHGKMLADRHLVS